MLRGAFFRGHSVYTYSNYTSRRKVRYIHWLVCNCVCLTVCYIHTLR